MNIVESVFANHNELIALKSVQQTSLSNLTQKYTYSLTRTFSFPYGRYPQTQEVMTFPKRFKLTFTPNGNNKAIAMAWCDVISSDGAQDPLNIVSLNQNIETTKITSWDICFLDDFKNGSDSIPATITFRATCVSLVAGSISLSEY